MAVEPEFPGDTGPGHVSLTVHLVSEQIERYYQSKGGEPERSDLDDEFWILGMADEDVPPVYRLPKPYAVYTIRCHRLKTDAVRERANYNNIDISSERLLAYYFQAHTVDYVGYTGQPYWRIGKHFDPFNKAANFTTLHPPKCLTGIKWYETKDEAVWAEKRRARKLREYGSFVPPSLLPHEETKK